MTARIKRLLLALLNLLALPGSGTYLSGRKKTGVVQIAIAIVGFLLTLLPITMLLQSLNARGITLESLQEMARTGQVTFMYTREEFMLIGFCLLGVFLFLANWVWSALTTGEIHPKPSPPPPLPRDQK